MASVCNSFGAVTCVAATVIPSDNYRTIILVGDHSIVKVYSSTTNEKYSLQETLEGHTGTVTGLVAVATDMCYPVAVSCGEDNTLRLWSLWSVSKCTVEASPAKRAECQSSFVPGANMRLLDDNCDPSSGISKLIMRDVEPIVASGTMDGALRVWSLPHGELRYILKNVGDVVSNCCLATCFVPERYDRRSNVHGPVIIGGTSSHTIQVWSLASVGDLTSSHQQGRMAVLEHQTMYGVDSTAAAAATSAANAATHGSANIELNEHPHVKKPALTVQGLASPVAAIAPFFYLGDPFAATFYAGESSIQVWSLYTGDLVKVLRDAAEPIRCIDTFAFNGDTVLVAGSGASSIVWRYSFEGALHEYRPPVLSAENGAGFVDQTVSCICLVPLLIPLDRKT